MDSCLRNVFTSKSDLSPLLVQLNNPTVRNNIEGRHKNRLYVIWYATNSWNHIGVFFTSHGNQKLRAHYLKPSDLDSRKKNTHFYSIIHKTPLTIGYKNFNFMKLIKKLSIWQVIMWSLLSDGLGHFIIAISMHLWNKTF